MTAFAEVLGSVGPGLMEAYADVTTVECDGEELVKAAAFLAWIESSIQVRMAAAARSWTPLAVLAAHRVPGIPCPEFPAPLRGVVSGMDRVRRMPMPSGRPNRTPGSPSARPCSSCRFGHTTDCRAAPPASLTEHVDVIGDRPAGWPRA